MISASMKLTGNVRFAGKMVKRTSARSLEPQMRRAERWVTQKRIPKMYGRRGMVKGSRGGTEQGKWAPNSPWTREAKGHNYPMVSKGGRGSGKMIRSYVLTRRRRGLRAWDYGLTNTARSREGHPYPSTLHTGAPRRTVRPRKPGGVLAWQIASGHWHVFGKTNPGPIPARPHIRLHRIDARALLDTMNSWVMHGKRARMPKP